MKSISVGSKFPAIAGRGEGVIFHADSNGYMMIYNFNNPTSMEISQTRASSPFEIAFLRRGCVIWILSKCGSLPWCDAPFHPALSPNWRELANPVGNEGHGLTLMMTDARTTEVKNLRLIGLGHDFSVSLLSAIRSLSAERFDPALYSMTVSSTISAYTTEQLVSMAEKRWRL